MDAVFAFLMGFGLGMCVTAQIWKWHERKRRTQNESTDNK